MFFLFNDVKKDSRRSLLFFSSRSCALTITPCQNCIICRAVADWLTCECVCSCAITPITAPSPTDRSISHALGNEFQKRSRPGCFLLSDESRLIFPKRLSATTTPHTWFLSRHRASTFIIRLALFLPTLLNWRLVCRTQILEAELAESSGRDAVLRKGASSPQIFLGSSHRWYGKRPQTRFLGSYSNRSSPPHTENQTYVLLFLLCNLCAKLCQSGNDYLTVACFESRGGFKMGRPLDLWGQRAKSLPLLPCRTERP